MLNEADCSAAVLSNMVVQVFDAVLKVPIEKPIVCVASGPTDVSVATTVPPDCVTNDLNPGPYQYTAVGFRTARSRHSGGVNLQLGDGSVRFVANGISLVTWRSLATRNGGEVLGSDF